MFQPGDGVAPGRGREPRALTPEEMIARNPLAGYPDGYSASAGAAGNVGPSQWSGAAAAGAVGPILATWRYPWPGPAPFHPPPLPSDAWDMELATVGAWILQRLKWRLEEEARKLGFLGSQSVVDRLNRKIRDFARISAYIDLMLDAVGKSAAPPRAGTEGLQHVLSQFVDCHMDTMDVLNSVADWAGDYAKRKDRESGALDEDMAHFAISRAYRAAFAELRR